MLPKAKETLMDPQVPFTGSREKYVEDVLSAMRSRLAQSGYVVHFGNSARFRSSNGFMAIRRSSHGDHDRFWVETAIIVRKVRIRRKGSTSEVPSIRIWRFTSPTPGALAVINDLVVKNLMCVRVMPHTLNEWRAKRREPFRTWSVVNWWHAVDISVEQQEGLDTGPSLYAPEHRQH